MVDKKNNPSYYWRRVEININPLGILMRFGPVLRQLRTKTGIGIKVLAPRLGVTYTYLSKLENGEVGPSEELVGRVAKYFKYDRDRLLLSAGKVPSEVLDILRETRTKRFDF